MALLALIAVVASLIYQEIVCEDVKLKYPKAQRDMTIHKYNEVQVQDPYRWMEDTDSLETNKFITEQNSLSKQYLENCWLRETINKKLKEMWNFDSFTCPRRFGDYYFYLANTGLQNNSILHSLKVGSQTPSILIDPNLCSTDGTVGLKIIKVSRNAKIVAYGLSNSGSDWITGYFRNVVTGKDYLEKIPKLRYTTFTWTHDENGVFYVRYGGKMDNDSENAQIKNSSCCVYYHTIGTNFDRDVPVFESNIEGQNIINLEVSHCGRWLIMISKIGDQIQVYLSNLKGPIKPNLKLRQIISDVGTDYQYVTNEGRYFFFRTNRGAPNYKLIKIDLDFLHPTNWRSAVRTREKSVMQSAVAGHGDRVIITYLRNVRHSLEVHKLSKHELVHKFDLPAGAITEISVDRRYTEFFFKFVSFLTPWIIYQGEFGSTVTMEVFNKGVVPGIHLSEFTFEQVLYTSQDDKKIPMFIIYKKNLVLNGKNPCILSAFGGFGVVKTPSFDVSTLMFINNMRGVYAIANIRGGGELGSEWHDEGLRINKQNSFNDFEAAAKFLFKKKYTNPKLLVANGVSNGGLVIAACANHSPGTFKAIIAEAGLFDMIRFHKFGAGRFWISEYGNPDARSDFDYLLKYSPLHNVQNSATFSEQYPSVLLTTGQHDERVSAFHSLKFIATLQFVFQNVKNQKNPFLIKIEKNIGITGKSTEKTIEQSTDIYCFIARTMNIQWIDFSSNSSKSESSRSGSNDESKRKSYTASTSSSRFSASSSSSRNSKSPRILIE